MVGGNRNSGIVNHIIISLGSGWGNRNSGIVNHIISSLGSGWG